MKRDLGFDLEQAIEVLHREAIAAGAVPHDDPRAAGPALTASAHGHAFGENCTKSPCRAAGLCLALQELIQFKAEAQDPEGFIVAADETEHMRKELQKNGDQYVKALEILLRRSEERHQRLETLCAKELEGQHELLCELPVQVLQQMADLRDSLEKLEGGLRGAVWTFELQQSGDKRSANLLLTAVCQHLKWGGLTYAEIARLIPEGGPQGAAERVRKRVKSDNARSLLPRELYQEFTARRAQREAERAQREAEERSEPDSSS